MGVSHGRKSIMTATFIAAGVPQKGGLNKAVFLYKAVKIV